MGPCIGCEELSKIDWDSGIKIGNAAEGFERASRTHKPGDDERVAL